MCLLQVTPFLVSTNRQALPAQLGIKQPTLHEDRISLAAEILDVRARCIKTLCRLLVIFYILL